ncbi:MAG: isochorismatase family cysteine hydrolase [Dehalococcoidia bacterium]
MVTLPPFKELALIVHDMTKNPNEADDKPDPAKEALIANHVRLLEVARKVGLPVFYTGHALRPDYKDMVMHGTSYKRGAYMAGTRGAEYLDELKPEPEDWIIKKGGGMSAFTGTPFEKWLRRLGVTTMIIGGVATHAGVESTVRDARDRDFDSIVAADACAGGTPANHEASLLNMRTWAQVVSTQEIVDALLEGKTDPNFSSGWPR